MPTYNDIRNVVGNITNPISAKIGSVATSPTYGSIQQGTTSAVGIAREGAGVYTDVKGRINNIAGGSVFNSITGVIDLVKFGQNIFKKVSLLPPNVDIPPEYIIRISSEFEAENGSNVSFVEAPIQDSIQMKVTSEWKSIIPTKASSIFTALSGKSLISKKLSRRLWVGTSPISIAVKLKFEAINNARTDVVDKCCFIQRLILPYLKATPGSINDVLQLLNPPGPSPFQFDPVEFSKIQASNTDSAFTSWIKTAANKTLESVEDGIEAASKYVGKGDRITISIGKFLTFDNVIVQESSVEYSPRFTKDGSPISGTVNLVFETYEIYSKQDMYVAYNYAKSANTQAAFSNAGKIESAFMKDL